MFSHIEKPTLNSFVATVYVPSTWPENSAFDEAFSRVQSGNRNTALVAAMCIGASFILLQQESQLGTTVPDPAAGVQ